MEHLTRDHETDPALPISHSVCTEQRLLPGKQTHPASASRVLAWSPVVFPQGSVPEPVLFHTFSNGLDEGTEGTLWESSNLQTQVSGNLAVPGNGETRGVERALPTQMVR